MMQTKIRHRSCTFAAVVRIPNKPSNQNWMSTRSNLQQWNLMKYESYGVQHSAPLSAFKDHTYQPRHSLCTRKEVQKQNYAIWLIFDESTHKEDWFIAFLTWISCMNFTPETIKLEALTFKEIKSGVAKQEDSSFAFMLLHNKSLLVLCQHFSPIGIHTHGFKICLD